MPIVKCVTMQRDETELLEPWLRYHGMLFGFDNLTVIDHGSVQPGTLATLQRAEAAGVTVYRQFCKPEDYLRKGQFTADVFRALDHSTTYDFALPLDCDEFFALWTEAGPTIDRSAIHRALEALDPASTHFRITDCVYNDPGRPGWFWAQGALKGFLRAGAMEMLDHGNHTFSERTDFTMAPCDFTHYHIHHKSFATMRENTRWKLSAVVNVDDEQSLRTFTGQGQHLIRDYLATEAEYYRQFDDHLIFYNDQLSRLLAMLGVTEPVLAAPPLGPAIKPGTVAIRLPRDIAGGQKEGTGRRAEFSPARYAHLNLDVAAAGVSPLRHFLLAGFNEPRAIE